MASRSTITDTDLTRLFTNVQCGMNERLSGTYKRIWVQYARIGKERVDVMFTLFPIVGEYRMIFFRGLGVTTLSVDSLIGLVSD
jgi:hypothetical protein